MTPTSKAVDDMVPSGGLAAPGSQPSPIPPRLRLRLAALRIDVSATLHDTDKSSVMSGRWHGQPIVAKLLTTSDPYWASKHAAEQDLYRRLNACPPPVRVARLLHAEPGLTVLEQLPGTRLANTRYPDHVDTATVEQILDALDLLHTWTPDAAVLGDPQPITDTYVQRQTATGQLTQADLAAIASLRTRMDELGIALRPEHGDAWATNLLAASTVSLVDLEHLGWHVPGNDWALLYLLLGPGTPPVRQQVLRRVEAQELQVPFALNLMLLACREWAMHHAWGGPAWELARPVLRANLDHARSYLYATARQPERTANDAR